MSRFFTAITLLALAAAAAEEVARCYRGSKSSDNCKPDSDGIVNPKCNEKWKSVTCNDNSNGCYAILIGEHESDGDYGNTKVPATIVGGCASKYLDSRTLCGIMATSLESSFTLLKSSTGDIFCGGKCLGDNCNEELIDFDTTGDNVLSDNSINPTSFITFFIVPVLISVVLFLVILLVFLPKKMDKGMNSAGIALVN